MAYYPQYYQPFQQQIPMQQQQPLAMQQPTQQIQQQQIQNSGFLSVPNEDIAMNYPVAPGNCVTFKIEGKPIVMEKSMGFSQLESPKIERYRLVKEELPVTNQETKREDPVKNYDGEIKEIWDQIEDFKSELESFKKEMNKSYATPTKKKKEVTDNDAESE